jgi:hypothetical protein
LKNVSHCLKPPLSSQRRNHCTPFARGMAVRSRDFLDQLGQVIGKGCGARRAGNRGVRKRNEVLSTEFPPEYELGALANKDFQYRVRTTFGKLKEKDWLN